MKPSTAPPPPAGPERLSSQPSDAESLRILLEEVAGLTGGELVDKVPPPDHETAVSDALSDKEVERKSKTIIGDLSTTEDYKVCEAWHWSCAIDKCPCKSSMYAHFIIVITVCV